MRLAVAALWLSLIQAPAFADVLTVGGADYPGLVRSIDGDMVVFDFGCRNDVSSVPIQNVDKVAVTRSCNDFAEGEIGGGGMDDCLSYVEYYPDGNVTGLVFFTWILDTSMPTEDNEGLGFFEALDYDGKNLTLIWLGEQSTASDGFFSFRPEPSRSYWQSCKEFIAEFG